MIKNIFTLLFFITTSAFSQHYVKGIMTPKLKSDWVILYRIEGTKQVFVSNTTIKKDSIAINGVKQEVGTFSLEIPKHSKPGYYRATYRLEGASFVDFFYNKEHTSFVFNPDLPNESIAFKESSENIFYQQYLKAVSAGQQKLDSIQIAALNNPGLNLSEKYNKAYIGLDSVYNSYLTKSENKFVRPFIKASFRKNPSNLVTTVDAYMNNLKTTYFDHVDFTNTELKNSSFITDKIIEYIFYINYSDDKNQQNSLFKESIDTVLGKVADEKYKKQLIVFLIEQFEKSRNIHVLDYLFKNYYKKLNNKLQDPTFIKEKEALFAAEVGRIAPDFSWTENKKNYSLSSLNDAKKYVLVFWSTSCSHCLREIPLLHEYLNDNEDIKVIGFALENDTYVWENYKKNKLQGWHNVLGLQKWKNKTARTYQVFATPSYFVLDENKKIIAKPEGIKELKELLESK